jgi:hypothetical protein
MTCQMSSSEPDELRAVKAGTDWAVVSFSCFEGTWTHMALNVEKHGRCAPVSYKRVSPPVVVP